MNAFVTVVVTAATAIWKNSYNRSILFRLQRCAPMLLSRVMMLKVVPPPTTFPTSPDGSVKAQ